MPLSRTCSIILTSRALTRPWKTSVFQSTCWPPASVLPIPASPMTSSATLLAIASYALDSPSGSEPEGEPLSQPAGLLRQAFFFAARERGLLRCHAHLEIGSCRPGLLQEE